MCLQMSPGEWAMAKGDAPSPLLPHRSLTRDIPLMCWLDAYHSSSEPPGSSSVSLPSKQACECVSAFLFRQEGQASQASPGKVILPWGFVCQ